MFGVLNRLAKYDIKEKKMLPAATLDHSSYCISFNKDGSKIYLAGTFNDVAIFQIAGWGYGNYYGADICPVIAASDLTPSRASSIPQGSMMFTLS